MYVSIHNHSSYSLLDSASRIKDLVLKAKSFSMPAIALTDHGNLYGAIEFYKQCHSNDIKPIIGCEVYYAPEGRFNRTSSKRHHLVLLCKDYQGYQNLVKLVSRSYSEGFYRKPRIDWELLQEYHQGLICTSACIAGEIPRMILAGQSADARLHEFKELFGEDYYLELMDHGMEQERHNNKELIKLAAKHGVKLIATNDTHYVEREDAYAQEILLCVQTKNVMSNPERFKFPNNKFYLLSPDEMRQLFKEVPVALDNTLEITEKCNLQIEFDQILLPKFPVEDAAHTLRSKVYMGIPKRLNGGFPTPEFIDRLEYELDVIETMGFSDYFLIVQDIIAWGKENGIPMGPGRGSAAGSLVSYLLGITELNPLEWGLIFERFLNPARISMPDIDVDVCYRRRGEIVDYITNRYGQDRVAQIITFGTMAAKAAIRDVGRVLEKPLSKIDALAKSVDSLVEAHHPQLQDVINTAKQIENLPRHTGVHAAGVIIGSEPLNNIVPTQVIDGQTTTQYEMSTCESLGLLKMDILGLKTLTIINDTVKLLSKRGINLDINTIPLDDQKVFQLLSRGDTVGVFQVESDGMQRILKKLRPDRFEDLIAMVALYRPGPLGSGMVDDFIDCKQGNKKIIYQHPILEPILKETYGVMLYQEQIMKIAVDMAGFSLPDSDLLRKAIGKKIPEVLAAQRVKFIEGAVTNGVPEATADEVFTLIDYFSGYGFNKSHSAAYALVSYQTAYLKAHYPIEFLAACMTNAPLDKIGVLLHECRRMGISVLPPDINKSEPEFSIEDRNIRFGLSSIKNLGEATISLIFNNRPFSDIYDVVYKTGLSKATLETLAKSGAFDEYGNRRSVVGFIPVILQATSSIKKDEMTLFGCGEELLPEISIVEEYSLDELLSYEKEYLGFYVSSHPLDAYKVPKAKPICEITTGKSEVIGVVTDLRCGIKNDKPWYFATVEDYSGELGVLVFGGSHVEIGKAYHFKGDIKNEENKLKMFSRTAKPLEQIA